MFQIQLQDAKPGEEVAWADGLTIYFGLRYGMGLESWCQVSSPISGTIRYGVAPLSSSPKRETMRDNRFSVPDSMRPLSLFLDKILAHGGARNIGLNWSANKGGKFVYRFIESCYCLDHLNI